MTRLKIFLEISKKPVKTLSGKFKHIIDEKILIVCANASTYHAPIFRALSNFKKDLKIKVLYGKNDLYEDFLIKNRITIKKIESF